MGKKIKIVFILLFLSLPIYIFNNCQNHIFDPPRGSSNQSSTVEDDFCTSWDTDTVCDIRRKNIEQNKKKQSLDLTIKTVNPIREFVTHDLVNDANFTSFDFNIFGTCNEGGFFDHIIIWKAFLKKRIFTGNNNQNEFQIVELCQSTESDFSEDNSTPLCIEDSPTDYCNSGEFFILVKIPKDKLEPHCTDYCFRFAGTETEDVYPLKLEIELQLIAFTENSEKITYPIKTKKKINVEIRQEAHP